MKTLIRTARNAALALAAVALVSASAAAEPLKFETDKVHSSVSFKIRHLVGKVTGKFNDFSATVTMDPKSPAEGSVVFAIKAASIDTGNEKRDNHLRSADFFEVEKFPEITFKSSKIVAKGGDAYEVSGILTMKGTAKPITLNVKMAGPAPAAFIPGGTAAGFSLQTTLNRKDFGVSWNKTLDAGSTILGDEVEVSIDLETNSAPDKGAAPAAKK